MAGELQVGQVAPEAIINGATNVENRIGQVSVEPTIDAGAFAEVRVGQVSVEVIMTAGCVGTPLAGGIYKIMPNKRNDTLWLDPGAGTTRDVAIPNPFIETAALGE